MESDPQPKRRSLNEGILTYYKSMQINSLIEYPMEQFSSTCREEMWILSTNRGTGNVSTKPSHE